MQHYKKENEAMWFHVYNTSITIMFKEIYKTNYYNGKKYGHLHGPFPAKMI